MDNKALSELIGLIYDAALDVSLWPRCLDLLNSELEVVLSGSPYAIASTDCDGLAGICDGDPHTDGRSSLRADGDRISSHLHPPAPDQTQRLSKTGLINLLRSHLLRALEFNRLIFETRQERNALQDLLERLPLGMLIDTEILKSLYCLTGAEARLVSSLVEGHSLNAIADAFSVSKHTIRNQLKSVYEKTGTHRQAELVRQVITGPAMLASLTNNESRSTNDTPTARGKIGARASAARRHQTMRLPDGRRLGFAEYGIPGGQPVMLMHAANGSRLERHPDETMIECCGVRLIIPSGPEWGFPTNGRD